MGKEIKVQEKELPSGIKFSKEDIVTHFEKTPDYIVYTVALEDGAAYTLDEAAQAVAAFKAQEVKIYG